jgi:hypothetical protein
VTLKALEGSRCPTLAFGPHLVNGNPVEIVFATQ